MPYELDIDDDLASQGWKVKIRDKERCEEPHVTIIRRTSTWRLGLRDLQFLDSDPPAREVPRELMDEIESRLADLRREWDSRYPDNPIGVEHAE